MTAVGASLAMILVSITIYKTSTVRILIVISRVQFLSQVQFVFWKPSTVFPEVEYTLLFRV
jgi:hypothetical protein